MNKQDEYRDRDLRKRREEDNEREVRWVDGIRVTDSFVETDDDYVKGST